MRYFVYIWPFRKIFLIFVFLPLLVGAVCSCGKKATDYEEYLIKVDSIAHPDTVAAGKSFAVRFYGIVGPNGCYRFIRFETEQSTGITKVWTVGERKAGQNVMCPEYLPMLDGTVLNLTAPDSGSFNIAVINPGLGNVLNSRVVVRRGNQ